jgi:Flp pilus assembly protein TadB
MMSRGEPEPDVSVDDRPQPGIAVSRVAVTETQSPLQTSSPLTTCAPSNAGPHAGRAPRIVSWLLVVVGVVLAAFVAWLVSTPSAVITAALIVALVAAYCLRAWGRRHHRRSAN